MIPTRPDRDLIRSKAEDQAFKSVVDDIMGGRTVKWCNGRFSMSIGDFLNLYGEPFFPVEERVEEWARTDGRDAVEERCQQLIEDAGL